MQGCIGGVIMPIIEPPFGPYKKFKENGLSKNEWYQLMIPWFYYKYVDGFDMPIEEITEILKVSSKYLKIKLQPEVDCINGHAASIIQAALGLAKNDMRPLVYYNRAQFEEWLKRHCVCTYQTKLVDVTERFPYVTQQLYHERARERVKNGAVTKARRKKILKEAKGYFGSKHRLFKTAKEQVMHSRVYAYRDRKQNKRNFRKLWIVRINAACRENEISYSRFINGLTKAGVIVNRKMLAEIAIDSPKSFANLVQVAKDALEGKMPKETKVAKKEVKKESKSVEVKAEETKDISKKQTQSIVIHIKCVSLQI